MGLQQKLDVIRQGFEKQVSAEAVAIMHRVDADLRNSGMMGLVPKEGHAAPPFELNGSKGSTVSLETLLNKGPVVMTFFRGHW